MLRRLGDVTPVRRALVVAGSLRRPAAPYIRTPTPIMSAVLLLALQVAAVYFPPLQAALQTAPLTPADWGLIALAAVPVFVVPEAAKALRHRRLTGAPPAPPRPRRRSGA